MSQVVSLTVPSRSTSNRYRVDESMWRKWSPGARVMFNHLYSTIRRNPELIMHPEMDRVSARLWRTVAWNAAWLAADAVDGR